MKTPNFLKRGATETPHRNLEEVTDFYLDKITEGDHVRVSISGESFWCKVTTAGYTIEGAVDNFLIASDIHGLYFGDPVAIGRDNVLDVLYQGKDRNQQIKRILTTQQ